MPDQKFITIDIGSAWTKAFLVKLDPENRINIENSLRLPTSWGDFSISVDNLLSKFSQKDSPKTFVSQFAEVETLAAKEQGSFVKEEEAASHLAKYFKIGHQNVSIIDGGASNFKGVFPAEEIGKFLSFNAESIFLENFLGKKRFRPHIIPVDSKELEVEEAFLRNSLKNKLKFADKGKLSTLVLTGGLLSGTPRLSRVALIVLDILEKDEAALVYLDREFFLPSFGALLATHKQLHTVDWGNWLETLGTFVSLGGARSLQFDWGYSELQHVDIADGEVSIIPAPVTQKIQLLFANDAKEKKKLGITGGSLGIVLDARAKPLPLTFGQAASRGLISSWFRQIEQAEITREAF